VNPLYEVLSQSSLNTTTPSNDDSARPIALSKGTCSTSNPHPIYNFLRYNRLSTSYHSFIFSVSSITIPKNVNETLHHPEWQQVMIVELQTLDHNSTWELVTLSPGKKQLDVDAFMPLKLAPMVNVIVSNHN